MNSIQSLLARIPKASKPRLVSNGFVCWIVYTQLPAASFFQALTDSGGWMLAEEKTQALWFFPSIDVLLGLARLQNWARLHPIDTNILLFDASLVVDDALKASLSIREEFSKLSMEFPKRMNIKVCTKVREAGRILPAVIFRQSVLLEGLPGEWFDLEASEQISMNTGRQWLFLIRPVGARSDKAFSKGWRAFFDRLEGLFVQNKVSFLHGEDHSLVLKLTSPRQLAKFVYELLVMIVDRSGAGWPCIYAGVEQGDMAFAPDFPKKSQQIWEALEPNILYLPLSSIYQLGDSRLQPVDSRFSQHHSTISGLFQVVLAGTGGKPRGTINVFLPSNLIGGPEAPCFYCGLRSHLPKKCPSRQIALSSGAVTNLDRFSKLDMDGLSETMNAIGKRIETNQLQALSELLGEKSETGIVTGALFDVNKTSQLRMMAMVWRAKGKAWPHGIDDSRDLGDDLLMSALEALRGGNMDRAMEKADQAMLRASKNYQPRVLLGFLALERDEFKRAAGYWEEAESLAYTSLQRSYIQFLQGRLREVVGDFNGAIKIYARALRESPGFLQARYRQAVCMIKSGFIHEAQSIIRDLIASDPDYYSVVLLDPEIDGGRSHLYADLWEIWFDAKVQISEVIGPVDHLSDLVKKWLPEDHDAYKTFLTRIDELTKHAGINNYVSCAKLVRGTLGVRDAVHARVKKDIKELTKGREQLLDRLRQIEREASWFPFPSMLNRFNKRFTVCAEKLNLVGREDLYLPDKFRQAHEAMSYAREGLEELEKNLEFLLGVRNGTLFLLLFGKFLLIYEIVALVVAGAVSLGLYWLFPDQIVFGRSMRDDRWMILNGSLIVFSFLAVVVSSVLAITKFDAYKNSVLEREDS